MKLNALDRNQVGQPFRGDGPDLIIVMRRISRPHQADLQPIAPRAGLQTVRTHPQIGNLIGKRFGRNTQCMGQAHQRDEHVKGLGSLRRQDPLIGQSAFDHQRQQGRRALDNNPPHPLPSDRQKSGELDEISKPLFTVHEQHLVGPMLPLPFGLRVRPGDKLRPCPTLPSPFIFCEALAKLSQTQQHEGAVPVGQRVLRRQSQSPVDQPQPLSVPVQTLEDDGQIGHRLTIVRANNQRSLIPGGGRLVLPHSLQRHPHVVVGIRASGIDFEGTNKELLSFFGITPQLIGDSTQGIEGFRGSRSDLSRSLQAPKRLCMGALTGQSHSQKEPRLSLIRIRFDQAPTQRLGHRITPLRKCANGFLQFELVFQRHQILVIPSWPTASGSESR